MQENPKDYGLVWFTTNLRVKDNMALLRAVQDHNRVVAVYCFDPRHTKPTRYGFPKTGRYRTRFLIECVHDLRRKLADLHIPLFTAVERPEKLLPKLAKEYGVSAVYHQTEWTQEEVAVIQTVRENLPAKVMMHSEFDQLLFHSDDPGIDAGEAPDIFTDFRRRIEKNISVRPSVPTPPAGELFLKTASGIPSLQDLGFEDFTTHPDSAFPFAGGEGPALERLNDYLFTSRNILKYKQTRNGLVGTEYSSKLSPWLATGCLSARTVYHAVRRFEKEVAANESTYWLIFELIWRDFFKVMALKYGNDFFKPGGIQRKDVAWENDPEAIRRWQEGKTGEPFIDANMIELKETGWMSNRGRQNAASYFAKTLGLDWRIGAAWFESLLIDHDVHSNYGNWMYVAGVGNDPRDRIFSAKRQAERYDPKRTFQRLWLNDELF